MKNNKGFFIRATWLAIALACQYLAGGDQPLWPALWLAPLFLLRFFRQSPSWLAFLVALPLRVAVDVLADRGMTPFPNFSLQLLYTTLGVLFGLLPYLADRLLHRFLPVWLRTCQFPSLAVALPFLLGSFGTWGALANGMDDLALLQLVSLTGVRGISFLVYWSAAMGNEIWERRGNWPALRNVSASLLAVLTLVYAFGQIRLHRNYQPRQSLRVAGIVGNPSLRAELILAFTALVKADPNNPADSEPIRKSMQKHYNELLAATGAMADSGFELVAWPEGAVVLFEEDEESMMQLALALAREKQIHIGVAVAVYQNLSRSNKLGIQPLFKNKLLLISPTGRREWEYSKSILVPGMETAVSIPGDGIMKISTGPIKISGAICFEMDFPVHIRQAAKKKADLLLAPANDWPAIKNIHDRMSLLRAIENGLSLLRTTTGGFSSAVDPYGRVLARIDNSAAAGIPLTAVLPIGPIETIYSRWGEWFSWLCLFSTLCGLLTGLWSKIRINTQNETTSTPPVDMRGDIPYHGSRNG